MQIGKVDSPEGVLRRGLPFNRYCIQAVTEYRGAGNIKSSCRVLLFQI
jgi:hypothetical protein